jgi:peptide/nickel transport system permease protein
VSVRVLLRNPLALAGVVLLGLFIVVGIFAPWIAPYSPTYLGFTPMLGPSPQHLLGTTANGQDILSQLIWGARASLLVGFVTAALTTALGILIGVFGGYVGGWLDSVLSSLTNVFLVMPGLPLMIIIASYVTVKGLVPIIAVITVTGWAWGARVMRSQVLSLRHQPFVEAAQLAGQSSWQIVFTQIIPNMIGIIVANFFGAALYAILSEAGLEFLGLGNVNTVTWGTMLYWAENDEALMMGVPQWLILPGLCIALVGTAFSLLNFAVDQLVDPRLRRA